MPGSVSLPRPSAGGLQFVLRTLGRAIRLAYSSSPASAFALALLTLVQGVVPAARLWLGKTILDAVVDGRRVHVGWSPDLSTCLVLLAALTVGSFACAYISNAVRVVLSERVAHVANVSVLEHGTRLDLVHFEQPSFLDLLRRAQQDGLHRPVLILADLVQLSQAAVACALMLATMLRFHWAPLVLLAGLAVVQGYADTVSARANHRLQTARTHTNREMSYLSYLLSAPEHVKEARVFRFGQYLLARYSRLWLGVHEQMKTVTRQGTVRSIVASSLWTASYIGLYGYLIADTVAGALTLGDLVLYAGAYLQCQSEATSVVRSISGLYQHSLFIQALYEYKAIKPRIAVLGERRHVAIPVKDGIEVRDVSFSYQPGEPWVLHHCSLHVRVGETVAVVGGNGAGKSTLVKLLCRLYDPSEGQILLDGVDIRHFDPDEYRRLIGLVFQDFSQYHLSVRTNVGIGCIERVDDVEAVRRAAILSGADPFVMALPAEYDTVLGRSFNNSCELSRGQWQRLAIARGAVGRVPILVLDEPSAWLDPEAEDRLLDHWAELVGDSACLLVSHRMSCVRRADRIVFIENGRVAEAGTHDQLVRLGGRYARVFARQARRYGGVEAAVPGGINEMGAV